MFKKDSDNQNQGKLPRAPDDGPAILLIQALQQLIEMLNDHNSQKVAEHTMPMLYQMRQIETKQQQAVYHLEAMRKQFDVMVSNNKLLENASLANQLLGKQHYQDHIIQPIIRSVFPVFDIIEDTRKFWISSGEQVDNRILDFINAVWSQLEQFLVNYDVHIISHNPNDQFDPQIMKPVKWTITDNRKLDGRMAESLQIGFRFGQDKVLRLESVSLSKYRASQTETITLNERDKNDNSRN